jgi:hypothetical protein
MNGVAFRGKRLLLLSLSTILGGGGLTAPALAQLVSTIPDVQTRETIDANGVDLATGRFTFTMAKLNFGSNASSRLALEMRIAGDYNDNYVGRIEDTIESGLNYTYATRSGVAQKFRNAGGIYSPVMADGTAMAHVAGSSLYLVTERDGTKVSYYQKVFSGDAECPGSTNVTYISGIEYPDGEKLTFTYKQIKVIKNPESPNCSYGIQ